MEEDDNDCNIWCSHENWYEVAVFRDVIECIDVYFDRGNMPFCNISTLILMTIWNHISDDSNLNSSPLYRLAIGIYLEPTKLRPIPHPVSLGFHLLTIILPTPVSHNCFLPFSLFKQYSILHSSCILYSPSMYHVSVGNTTTVSLEVCKLWSF